MGLKCENHRIRIWETVELKSDQNGIEIQIILDTLSLDFVLKSDQNGIEIGFDTDGGILENLLKSDQNGIEMERFIAPWISMLRVKIRPKWDWNVLPVTAYLGGYLVKIRPKWDWNYSSFQPWNHSMRVKIRPKWDWNPPRRDNPRSGHG